MTGESLQDDLPMLKLIVFGVREELVHGERQKFGLARNVRRLKEKSRQALHHYVVGELSAERAAKYICLCQQACDEAQQGREQFLETVDQFLIQSVVNQEYLEAFAEEYATTYGWSEADIVEELTNEQRHLQKAIERDLLYEDVYQPLREIEEQYTPVVAEAVGHAALDIPRLLHPLDELLAVGTDIDTIAPAEITTELLVDRFESAREVLEELPERTVIRYDRNELRHELLDRMPQTRNGATHPAPLRDLPLLDRPSRALEADHTMRHGFEAVEQSRSEVDMMLNGAFQFVGNLGGATYITEGGEENLMINPWVDDETVATDRYGTVWQQEFFADHVVTLVWKAAKADDRDDDEIAVTCPMCLTSPGDTCRTNGHCLSASYRERLEERLPQLLPEIRRWLAHLTA
jgi:hypothetical protein